MLERDVEVERRAQGPRSPVGGVEEVDPAAELVPQPFCLGGPLDGGKRLSSLELDEPSDDPAERNRDEAAHHDRLQLELVAELPVAKRLGEDE